ncbi:1-aminocyclopropane-1-carboxylate deaminase/D-cysteine desulfhydrase [Flavobacterium sp. D33]|nr:1-aminocyclopropane-1-carboxylate deaminase/D-cysteine desulfhydrase [Flavobacterium selenitireducens]
MKRDDLLDPTIPGNKLRKLKYNLEQARTEGKSTILTFGGAFSNHISAIASAGARHGFATIGIIRGEELTQSYLQNPTLSQAAECGMQLEFINRADYRNKSEKTFLGKLEQRFGDFYLLPEGGTNSLAVKGCEEILSGDDFSFDYICCAVGTGGTLAGIINSSETHHKIIGFSSLKGTFDISGIAKFVDKHNWKIISDYHFGGYGKVTNELVDYINCFYNKNKIPLDPVYTGKMMFGIEDLIRNGYFPKGSRILAIHTGGLQGIAGMNQKLKTKNLHIIEHG